MGRWVSEDPIGLAGGINPYAYANNSPTNLRDPSGMLATCNAWVSFKYWRETLKVISSSIRLLGYEGNCDDEGKGTARQGGTRGSPTNPLTPDEDDRLRCIVNRRLALGARNSFIDHMNAGQVRTGGSGDSGAWGWVSFERPNEIVFLTNTIMRISEYSLAFTAAHEMRHIAQKTFREVRACYELARERASWLSMSMAKAT